MKDRTLLRIALITAIVGLFLAALFLEKEQVNLTSRLDELPEDTEVTIIGKVVRVTNTEKVAFLEIQRQKIEPVTVVLFKEDNITIKPGDYVEIEGSTEIYEGKPEIIGNKVTLK